MSQNQSLLLAQCMRSHGVPKYPDPNANGGRLQAILNAGLDPKSPTFQSALLACKKFTPAAALTPAQRVTDNEKGIEFAQCMRSHGVLNYPDPSVGPDGEQVINLDPEHIDPKTPAVQAAGRDCQKVVPGSK